MLYKLKENVLREILPMADEPRANVWLEEEVNHLAIKHAGLDAIPLASIYVMAQLYVGGQQDENDLAKTLNMDVTDIYQHLEFLCERKFAQEDNYGVKYSLTETGEDASRAVGTNMVIRKRMWMKGRVEHLDALYRHLESF
ncbi:hypothetical protein LG277_11965 [Vreelandella aquamarina]|uniref:hypothetical protein n=1 Tax=Vreelandella aquamarina TaxID=77097 RepID=UPI00384DBC45